MPLRSPVASSTGRAPRSGSCCSCLSRPERCSGFAELVDEVLEGSTDAFDRGVLLALRSATDLSDPIGPRWLELAIRDITALGGTTVLSLITIAAVGYLVADRKGHTALLLVGAVIGGVTISYGMKLLVERPRPRPRLSPRRGADPQLPQRPCHAIGGYLFLTLGAILARAQARGRMKLYVVWRGRRAYSPDRSQPHLPRRALADGRARGVGPRLGVGDRLLDRGRASAGATNCRGGGMKRIWRESMRCGTSRRLVPWRLCIPLDRFSGMFNRWLQLTLDTTRLAIESRT